ncbi:MAG: GLPGLI family protein [Ginsengibacter sp.]
MKIKAYFLVIILLAFTNVHAQQFITKAVIEYEVKSNIQKTMGNGTFQDLIKDQLPKFKTGYFNFTFANNKSIYKFDHWSDDSRIIPNWWKKSDEDNVWYYDYNSGKYDKQKSIEGALVNIEDSITKLNWKITNDTRVIDGFNCRKAVAVILDSVYVFAFYTDEIMISGGPCSINGLPGMILGVTIPRLYASWIATKVMLNNVNESLIKPVAAKKSYDMKFLENTLSDRFKDWIPDDDDERQQKARYFWGFLL